MTVTHLWFGTDARPLAGWYHAPADGLARGAVALCSAFGVEAAAAAAAMRELAERLVGEGLVVLRFDYDGTGDSAGDDQDDARVESWRSSIVTAVEFLRSSGHTWIGAVGLRLGATLLAETLRGEASTSATVLWDPCISGRAFLREQQLLLRVLSREEYPDDGCRYGPGVTYTASTVAALSTLSLKDALGEIDGPTLVLSREGHREVGALADSATHPDFVSREVSGQSELVGVEPAAARVPVVTLELITEWLSKMSATELYESPVPQTRKAVVGHSDAGEPVVEHVVSIGGDNLFAICSEPHTLGRSMSVIFLNAGHLDHIGPSRLWVELSRRWAALGFRSFRIDLSGIGESPPLEGMTERITRSVHALRQVAEVIDFVEPDNSCDVLLVGLCSGAYQAMEVALSSRVRAVFLVNPSFRFDALDSGKIGESATKREVAETPAKWYSALEQLRFLWPLARHFPDIVWRIINSLGVRSSRADSLVRLAKANVDTFVVCDSDQAESLIRGRKADARRLAKRGALTFAHVDPLDHTVFGPLARQSVSNVLTSWLEERYGRDKGLAPLPLHSDGQTIVSPPH
jgi:alpha-beta hydrolase superfamily lysophospholipase